MQEVNNKGPSKGELKLKARIETLKNQIEDNESKLFTSVSDLLYG
jgi:hypothetical protein